MVSYSPVPQVDEDYIEEEEDDLVIREELPPARPEYVPKFSKLEIFFGSIIALVFGLLATFEVTSPFLGGLEAWYYKRKGLTSTVWITSFGVGFLLGLVPGLNWFVYVLNFWVIIYIDKHPRLEALTQKAGAVGSKLKAKGNVHPTNAKREISHEVSPSALNHEVAPPASLEGRAATSRQNPRLLPEKSANAKPLNALEQTDRDLTDPTISERESLFDSPEDPFAKGQKARTEAEEQAETEKRQKEEAARRSATDATNEDIEERANTGTAFMRRLEKNLAGTGDVDPTPPPAPLPDIVPSAPQTGETVDLKKKGIDREAA
jgi:hypothetical protein